MLFRSRITAETIERITVSEVVEHETASVAAVQGRVTASDEIRVTCSAAVRESSSVEHCTAVAGVERAAVERVTVDRVTASVERSW